MFAIRLMGTATPFSSRGLCTSAPANPSCEASAMFRRGWMCARTLISGTIRRSHRQRQPTPPGHRKSGRDSGLRLAPHLARLRASSTHQRAYRRCPDAVRRRVRPDGLSSQRRPDPRSRHHRRRPRRRLRFTAPCRRRSRHQLPDGRQGQRHRDADFTRIREGDSAPNGDYEPCRGAHCGARQPDYLSSSRYLAPAPVL